jgi:hypothetical protein
MISGISPSSFWQFSWSLEGDDEEFRIDEINGEEGLMK